MDYTLLANSLIGKNNIWQSSGIKILTINVSCDIYSDRKSDTTEWNFRPLRSYAEEMEFTGGLEEKGDDYRNIKEDVLPDWTPPGLPPSLARKYVDSLPKGLLSSKDSAGALRRRRQLEKQFPLHDIDQDYCHHLSQQELDM